MEIALPWGEGKLVLNTPDSWQIVFPEKNQTQKKCEEVASVTSIIRHSLENPVQSPPLKEYELKGKNVVVVVDDNTRPTPVHLFFRLLLDSLVEAGAELANCLLIPALGIHTPMSEEEMSLKVGHENLKQIPWKNHDAFDDAKNVYFGTTSRGTPVKLNSHLSNADLIISVGMVEPHLWAGFGGGLKNLLPGLASVETIGIHHTIIAEPPYKFNRVGIEPADNSFRQDLEEIRGMIATPVFCLNVVMEHHKGIIASFAGDPIACHRKAIDFNKMISGLHLDSQVDAIIVNSFPMDLNFKQSMKGIGNSLPALKPGGTVIGFLKAERGLDDIILPSGFKPPYWLLKKIFRMMGPSRVLGFLDRTRKGLNVEERFLIYYSLQLMREHDLFLYVPNLTIEEGKKLGYFKHSTDPQKNIDYAAKKIPNNARVAIFAEAGATFPIVE